MLPNDAFQKLLYDLFCLWHGVQRHYDPPRTDTEEQRMSKLKTMICKILGEIDARVERIKQNGYGEQGEAFYEEFTMLIWNLLCITSRMQPIINQMIAPCEEKMLYQRLNQALVELVNHSRNHHPYPSSDFLQPQSQPLKDSVNKAICDLHELYIHMNSITFPTPENVEIFRNCLQNYAERTLAPCLVEYKGICNDLSQTLWKNLRDAQVERMRNQSSAVDKQIETLVSFYSNTTYLLAVLGARLQGFRFDLSVNKKFFNYDVVQPLTEAVFGTLELLMSNCVLATEPSTSAILVTNNLFSMNCGALARGVVFKDFEVQIVSEETADHILSEIERQRLLQQTDPIGPAPSAALLAMKPTTGTKRTNAAINAGYFNVNIEDFSDSANNTAHKKSDVNSKESVVIYPVYNSKNRYWAANYPHLLCTTRQKGRHSMQSSYQDLSPAGISDKDKANSSGKRPIYYFHIIATMFSPSGRFATAHTLSLPFTIATRRNQDCQVQRMMSSYTATIFWLYGCDIRDKMSLVWSQNGMHWDNFKQLFKQHFKVNADVQRSLIDADFELLRYKLHCNDCSSGALLARKDVVTFKNILCPHLRYECGSTNVRFSVWRGMLELLQIFHDSRNNVRKLWEMGLLMGFAEFAEVDQLLNPHKSALIMRLSFVTGGTICFTLKTTAHTLDHQSTKPIHLEPLDLKRLQQKCLKDYLRDIADAERVKYIMNVNNEIVRISEVLAQLDEGQTGGSESRDISSNITHMGDIDTMEHIRFTAMRIAVVTCKIKAPSTDKDAKFEPDRSRLQPIFGTRDDNFLKELVDMANAHGKTKQDILDALEFVHDPLFNPFQQGPGPIRKPSSVYEGPTLPLNQSQPAPGLISPAMISPPPAKLSRCDFELTMPTQTSSVNNSHPKSSQLPSPNHTTLPTFYNNILPYPPIPQVQPAPHFEF